MVAQVMGDMDLPASSENQRRVEAALGEVVDQAVEDLRDSSFVEVDPSPVLGRDRDPALQVRLPVGPPRQGDRPYPLRDGPALGPAPGHDYDWRQLSETGIQPGMRLEAIRPSRRHKQHS
jgi:hypothetical protein